jgi:hypothetical protein
MADSTTDEFKHFPKLPAELREEIWRLCLPYRVCELETPAPGLLFMKPSPTFNGPWPCELLHTSYMNKRLPLISKVCHEARYVALKNGAIARQKTDRWPWGEGVWGSTQDLRDTWQDPQRDIVHRHWTRAYEAYYDFDVSNKPISHLVYTARQMRNGGSLMAESLFDHCFSWPCNDDCELSTRPLPPDRIKALEALLEVPEWRVIVKVVVVHCDLAGAARTGLFGLLGDAPVQIVDASDELKVAGLYNLASESECANPRAVRQNLYSERPWYLSAWLKHHIEVYYRNEALVKSMRPAIMFRLCTRMCDERSGRYCRRGQNVMSARGKAVVK